MHHGVYALVSVFEEINLQQKKGKKKRRKKEYLLASISLKVFY